MDYIIVKYPFFISCYQPFQKWIVLLPFLW
ncbi:unnamed protein product [Nezara viridula]|uniref:Uncharacterized protein n=1 Tax=Nezara viridula TaxID=85310 RepID=A0A9P0MXE2_NEZVI|nr:unnamed protein product [Nezara viridula]